MESAVILSRAKRMGWMLNPDSTATGAVVVVDGTRAVGIFTERDVLKRVAAHPELEAFTQELSINTFRYVPADLRAVRPISATLTGLIKTPAVTVGSERTSSTSSSTRR